MTDISKCVEVWTDDAREAARWEAARLNSLAITITNGEKSVYGFVRIFRKEEVPTRWQAYIEPQPADEK